MRTSDSPHQAPLASPATEDDAPGGDGEADGSGDAGGDGSDGGCPQLVSFYDAYVSPTEGTVSIVQEYMDGGSLQVSPIGDDWFIEMACLVPWWSTLYPHVYLPYVHIRRTLWTGAAARTRPS